jgi:hypothetical protein
LPVQSFGSEQRFLEEILVTKPTPLVRASLAALAALALAAGASCFSGCAPDKPSAPPPAAAAPAPAPKPASLAQIKSELIEAKAQIDATTDSLSRLQKSSTEDATANYNAYSEQYLKLKSKAETIKARSADLRARASAYLETWNKQATVENAALRRQAIQQQGDAEKLFNTISSEMELTRIEFNPFMTNLTDVGKYLKNNLSPASLQSTSELVEKSNGQAKSVNQHIDAIIVAIDKMAGATGESTAVGPASATPDAGGAAK